MSHSHAPETANDGHSNAGAATVEVGAPTRPDSLPEAPDMTPLACDTGDSCNIMPVLARSLETSRQQSSPLPGLKLRLAENIGENHVAGIALGKSDKPNPLPGTIIPKCVENAGKSSPRRSPQRFCYTTVLHNGASKSAGISSVSGKRPRKDCLISVLDGSSQFVRIVADRQLH